MSFEASDFIRVLTAVDCHVAGRPQVAIAATSGAEELRLRLT